jgi:hypothetical protein
MKQLFLAMALVAGISLNALAADDTSMASAQSMGATFSSKMYALRGATAVNIHAIVSSGSSPVGVFKLQLSGKENPAADTDWVDYDGSSMNVTADGGFMWNISSQAARFVRVVYTRTSGSATANIYANAAAR